MGNCHFKTDFDAENITGKLFYIPIANIGKNIHNTKIKPNDKTTTTHSIKKYLRGIFKIPII